MQTLTCWWKHKETLQPQQINLIWSRLLSPKMAAEEGKITSCLLLICQYNKMMATVMLPGDMVTPTSNFKDVKTVLTFESVDEIQ